MFGVLTIVINYDNFKVVQDLSAPYALGVESKDCKVAKTRRMPSVAGRGSVSQCVDRDSLICVT